MTKAQTKINEARRAALCAALSGKSEADSESLSRSYALPRIEIQRMMKSMGVTDNGKRI